MPGGPTAANQKIQEPEDTGNQKIPGRRESPGSVRVEQVVELLRASGSRITSSRRILLRCLFDGAPHRSAEEIASEVQAIAPDVHISTIYRNLYELERLGVVVHAHLGPIPAMYHLTTETHGHLVCEVCGPWSRPPATS